MEAATVMSNELVQICVYHLVPYDAATDEMMYFVDGGPYRMVAEGFTGREGHLGLEGGTGVRGHAKPQGHVIAVDAASRAGLQEGMLEFVYEPPPRRGLRRTALL